MAVQDFAKREKNPGFMFGCGGNCFPFTVDVVKRWRELNERVHQLCGGRLGVYLPQGPTRVIQHVMLFHHSSIIAYC